MSTIKLVCNRRGTRPLSDLGVVDVAPDGSAVAAYWPRDRHPAYQVVVSMYARNKEVVILVEDNDAHGVVWAISPDWRLLAIAVKVGEYADGGEILDGHDDIHVYDLHDPPPPPDAGARVQAVPWVVLKGRGLGLSHTTYVGFSPNGGEVWTASGRPDTATRLISWDLQTVKVLSDTAYGRPHRWCLSRFCPLPGGRMACVRHARPLEARSDDAVVVYDRRAASFAPLIYAGRELSPTDVVCIGHWPKRHGIVVVNSTCAHLCPLDSDGSPGNVKGRITDVMGSEIPYSSTATATITFSPVGDAFTIVSPMFGTFTTFAISGPHPDSLRDAPPDGIGAFLHSPGETICEHRAASSRFCPEILCTRYAADGTRFIVERECDHGFVGGSLRLRHMHLPPKTRWLSADQSPVLEAELACRVDGASREVLRELAAHVLARGDYLMYRHLVDQYGAELSDAEAFGAVKMGIAMADSGALKSHIIWHRESVLRIPVDTAASLIAEGRDFFAADDVDVIMHYILRITPPGERTTITSVGQSNAYQNTPHAGIGVAHGGVYAPSPAVCIVYNLPRDFSNHLDVTTAFRNTETTSVLIFYRSAYSQGIVRLFPQLTKICVY